MSHPAWVCGLKLENLDELTDTVSVTPCVGVWIETISIIIILVVF